MAKIPPPPFHRVGDKLNAGPDFVMMFGKHKGMTVEDVLDMDARYLVWAHENVEYFKLHPAVLEIALKEVRKVTKVNPSAVRAAMRRAVGFSLNDIFDDYDNDF